MAKADSEHWVFVVEGEKDADNLARLVLTATTCPMGAGKWHLVDDKPLVGRKVAILPDVDIATRLVELVKQTDDCAPEDEADDVIGQIEGTPGPEPMGDWRLASGLPSNWSMGPDLSL